MQLAPAGRRPWIDLHLHLEGSLPRKALTVLAARHHCPVPPQREFSGFKGFLQAFGAVCDLLRDEEDFEFAARSVIAHSRALGLIHVEILFSPQVFARRGIPPDRVIRGLLSARRRESALAPSVVYIMDGVRQWGGEWFEAQVRAMKPFVGKGLAGVGIGGDEREISCREFSGAFRAARTLGLRTTVHAGEASGPESIRDALKWLLPDRLGHGIGAAGDPELCRLLARRRLPLEVCPSSNIATGVVASHSVHPVRRLYESGLYVTIGSDDGSFFNTNVPAEMELLHRVHGFSAKEIDSLTRAAARAAFIPPDARLRLERCVEAWMRRTERAERPSRRGNQRAAAVL